MTDYILDTVHRLQKKLHTKDPFEAAKNLGIHVLYRNLNNLKGFYTLRCRERYIVINESLSQNEQKIVMNWATTVSTGTLLSTPPSRT
mgnify:CR=1 FL=1